MYFYHGLKTIIYDKHLHMFLWICVLVNTLRVAKPEKGQKIEAMLIQMAQTGQLGGRIGEDELIGLLGKIKILCRCIKFI